MMTCERNFLLCTAGLLLYHSLGASAVQHATNLIWAQRATQKFGLAKIVGIEGDPKNWISYSQRLNIRQISAPSVLWHFKALAFKYSTQTLYWSERGNKRIQGLILNGTTETTNLIMGTSSEVDGLVVDWLSDNLYWTDAIYNWIVMVPLKSGVNTQKIIVDTGLDRPMGIAVYPQKGYLFWSDWGVRPIIEMSDLLGQNRRTLIENQVMHPRGLAVDYAENRLYWLDSALDTIESVEFSGANRRVVATRPGTHFYGIALYDKYVFVTENMRGHLQIYSKRTGHNYLNYNLGGNPYGIIMYKASLQKGDSEACKSRGCQHICVQRPLTGPTCYCGDGYKLSADFKSCIKTARFVESTHIYTIGSAICYYPSNIADMPLANISLDTQCFLKDGFIYSALAYNVWSDELFFSQKNNGSAAILRYRMIAASEKEIIVRGVGDVQGLAVDWISSNLYWTDSLYRQVSVSRLDGSHPIVLINDSLVRPLGIAVNPHTRLLYWTDPGTPRIEVSYLDGSGRRTLAEGRLLGSPNHLFLDVSQNKLYWTDSERDYIRVHDLTLDIGRTLMAVPDSDMYGISIFKVVNTAVDRLRELIVHNIEDYILWTDRHDKNGLHVAVLKTGEKVRGIIHPDVGMATDIVTFSKLNQPTLDKYGPCVNETLKCNPCTATSNGGCQQLCLANNSTVPTCACAIGYRSINGSCRMTDGTIESLDNFLIVADASQKEIFQIPVATGIPRAIGIESLLPVAVDYDPIKRHIYWTDIRSSVIKRISVDGFGQEVVKHLSHGSTADGVAVDYLHRLLYYTDASERILGVVNITAPFWEKILINTGLDKPRDIVVDPLSGYMYWTDWGRQPKIMKSEMDGSNMRPIVLLVKPSWPNGITIDSRLSRLYWCDARTNIIMSSDLNGQRVEILFQEKKAHYFAITVMGDNLYITDWVTKRPRVINKTKPTVITPLGIQIYGRLNGIHAFNSSETITGENACLSSRCAHLCLPKPHGAVACSCANGYRLDIDMASCLKFSNTTLPAWSTTHIPQSSSSPTPVRWGSSTVSPRMTSRQISLMTSEPSSVSNLSSDIPNTTTAATSGAENKTFSHIDSRKTTPHETKRHRIKEGGLSIGAIIGIVIVVLVCLVGTAVAVVLLHRRLRGGGREKLVEEVSPENYYHLAFADTQQPSAACPTDRGIENPMYGCTFTQLQQKDAEVMNHIAE